MQNFSNVDGDAACGRATCGHPLRGLRPAGHFNSGNGPCRTPGCKCPSFALALPATALEGRGLLEDAGPVSGA